MWTKFRLGSVRAGPKISSFIGNCISWPCRIPINRLFGMVNKFGPIGSENRRKTEKIASIMIWIVIFFLAIILCFRILLNYSIILLRKNYKNTNLQKKQKIVLLYLFNFHFQVFF